MGFVHLHNHTEFSLLSGACKVDELVKGAKKLGQKAVAITDEFNLFGAVKFFCCCKKNGLKPIIGCEILVNGVQEQNFELKNYKLVVLCKNRTGYENLVKIVSFASTQKANETIAVSLSFLESHCSGLIGLSCGLSGEVASSFLNFGYDAAKSVAKVYSKIFGVDGFFLELQNHGLLVEKKINDCFFKISNEINLGVVATNNVYYVNKNDYIIQKILNSIKFNSRLHDEKTGFSSLPNDEFYLKTEFEMKNLFVGFANAVENTEKIANICCFEFEFNKVKVPKFEQNGVFSSKNLLFKKAKSGLISKFGTKLSDAVLKRFTYEFNVVVKMGFVDYFLIVQDYVNFAHENGISVGPGRGSGAGSLLAYCLNITSIDPLKYGLSFERFLNPDRQKMPDFDVDFCNERRNEVLNYVIKKYGKDRVAKIVTFGTLAAKAALRDVARVLGFSSELVDKMVKFFPNRLKISLVEVFNESKHFKNLVETVKEANLIFKYACLVEGYLKNTSTHAAAVVFAQNSLGSYVPLIKHENVVLTQYDMDDVAALGFLKMDFLGLRNLTVVGKTEKLIQQMVSRSFNIEKIGLNDEKTFDLFSKGHTIGIFQFESKLTRKILVRFKPRKIDHLMIIMSLNRPGPSQFINLFFDYGKSYFGMIGFNEKVNNILKSTNGIILFQEQVMQIFREVAGYSFARTDLIRKAITEKNNDLIAKEREVFLFGLKTENGIVESVGAVNLGFNFQESSRLFEILTKFSAYAFNKSHAAAYSLIAYRNAFLKANFPVIYMTCLLNSVVLTNRDKLLEYLTECERLKIKVLPLNINTSGVYFEILENSRIGFSFLAVKGVGKIFAEQIVNERKNGKFTSVENFFSRIGFKNLNRLAITCLIKNGAFYDFEKTENEVLNTANEHFNSFYDKKHEIEGQISLFSDVEKAVRAFVAKVLFIKKIVKPVEFRSFVCLKLFGKFKNFFCLINENYFKNLNFELKVSDCFKFYCSEEQIGTRKFCQVKKVEELSRIDEKKLILVVKIELSLVKKIEELEEIFKHFVGDSLVFFVLENENGCGYRFFKKKGFEKIKLCYEVFNKLENLFGKDCFKIEIKK